MGVEDLAALAAGGGLVLLGAWLLVRRFRHGRSLESGGKKEHAV